MQVTADLDFRAVRECQILTFSKGEVIDGDLARYLLDSGSPVTEVKPDLTEVEPEAEAEVEPEPTEAKDEAKVDRTPPRKGRTSRATAG